MKRASQEEGILFSKLFLDSQKKNVDCSPKSKNFELWPKEIPMKRASQEEQKGANFNSIATSSEEL